MQMNETNFRDSVPVDGYGPGFFRMAGQVHQGPLLATAASFGSWQGLDDVQPILDLIGKVDVIFFGMGADIAYLPQDLRSQLENAGVGVEVMNSGSACRTYNVVLTEGRRVALAALPV
jgi:uncharacterized protein